MVRFIKLLLFLCVAVATPVIATTVHAENIVLKPVDGDEISNDQMVELYQGKAIGSTVVVVDSRPGKKYAAGHIPGAISLPFDELKKNSADVIQKLNLPKTAQIIFYCAGRECTLSPDSAKIFRADGYPNAFVYYNGIPGWNKKAQPLQAEESFLKKGNVILLDLAAGKETIVTAKNTTVQLSLADLKGESAKKLFTGLSKNAPLVVINRNDMKVVDEALEELRDSMDFRRLAYFNLDSWKEKLAAAPAVSSLSWAPVYEPGQVSPKQFEQAVASGQYLLDVRPAADFAKGHFKGAINIPIEDLEKRYAEVPKDKAVFISCATGAKSSKTFDILTRKGYSNMKYLDAEISCKGEECKIKE